MYLLLEVLVASDRSVAGDAQDASHFPACMAVIYVDRTVPFGADGEVEFLLTHGAAAALRFKHLDDLSSRDVVVASPITVALGFFDFRARSIFTLLVSVFYAVPRMALTLFVGIFFTITCVELAHLVRFLRTVACPARTLFVRVFSGVARGAIPPPPLPFFLCQALARHHSQLLMPVVGSYLHAPPSASCSAGFSLRMPLRIPAARKVVQPLAPPS